MFGAALIFVGGSISLPALIYLLVGFAEPVFVLIVGSIIIYSIFKKDGKNKNE